METLHNNPSNTPCQAALVVTAEERAAVFAIRMIVFVEEQGVPPEEELDALDVTATHFLARLLPAEGDESGEIIATARLIDKGEGMGKIGRVAVLKEHRGRGAGALLMRFVEETACERGFTRLVLEAQVHAIPFYEHLGYTAEGGVFLDCGIEHRLMHKRMKDEG